MPKKPKQIYALYRRTYHTDGSEYEEIVAASTNEGMLLTEYAMQEDTRGKPLIKSKNCQSYMNDKHPHYEIFPLTTI